MVVTFGLSIVIQNALLQLFSADPRSLDAGTLAIDSVQIGDGIALGTLPLVSGVVSLACTAALQMLFDRTALGARVPRGFR